jgi:hypothetical protein
MIKLALKQPRLFSFVCFPALILAVLVSALSNQQNAGIVLHDEHLNINPKEFYIAGVIDDRDDRRAIAWLLPFTNADGERKTYPVDFQGGFASISRFIENSILQNTALHPVAIHVKKFMVTETAGAGDVARGSVVLAVSFDLIQGDERKHLVDYTGSANYTRTIGPAQDIEPTLRKMLGSSIEYFNNWINKQAGSDERLAKAVKVSFTDYSEKPEGDTIYYSVNRPLTWADFKGDIPNSKYAAEVLPGIGYNERVEVKNGVVLLNLEIKVYLPKSACWAREGSRDDYTLNHEQRHFDLAKIVAMRFVQKIQSENLPVGNYDGFINVDYLDAYRRMDTLEMRYDNETSHGLDHLAQGKWDERIDAGLRRLVHSP